MLSLLKRYQDALFVGLLLIGPLGYFLTLGHRGRQTNWVDRTVLTAASPLQSLLTAIVSTTRETVESYVALRGAREDARRLEAQLSEARAELNALKEAQAENVRLKQLLGYVEPTVEQEIFAHIVGLNPSAQFLSVRLNRGENDGVRAGMPVVTADGVVGHVVRSVGRYSDVMLISDPASRLAAVVRRSSVRATATGADDGRTLSLENVLRDAEVTEGDEVLTSGTDGIFPKGLVVGTVDKVTRRQTAMFLSAQVVPSVNLARVQEVMVIPLDPLAFSTQGRRAP